ncbi:MAG: hypothetical protein DMD43_04150 [Gemmatimonadetes bacterium]|nr:MAG: hypothetical protein DMD43_04150 [Gemmatimonadota bacterium]
MAVFTDEYPARNATGFERDMRALLAAGFDLDIFAARPLDPDRWVDSTGLFDAGRGGRVLVHHLRPRELLHWAPALIFHRPGRCLADTGTILPGVATSGPVSLARTATALPRAWVWAAQQADWYGHVLAYWGVHAGSCAYAFHRLQSRLTPFTLWLHDGVDLRRRPGLLRRALRYADNVITCSEFNRENLLRRFADLAFRLGRKLHVLGHGLDLAELPYDPEWRPDARILAVGRLAAGMGHEGLVRATQLLSARGGEVTLQIVGDGPELGRLRGLAADLGIAGRTHFCGRLSAEETRRSRSTGCRTWCLRRWRWARPWSPVGLPACRTRWRTGAAYWCRPEIPRRSPAPSARSCRIRPHGAKWSAAPDGGSRNASTIDAAPLSSCDSCETPGAGPPAFRPRWPAPEPPGR